MNDEKMYYMVLGALSVLCLLAILSASFKVGQASGIHECRAALEGDKQDG